MGGTASGFATAKSWSIGELGDGYRLASKGDLPTILDRGDRPAIL